MRIGLLVLDLYVPEAHSLKDKRRIVRSLKDRATSRHNVSVAEVDHQDSHQQATLAFVTVATTEQPIHRLFDALMQDAQMAAPGVRESTREIIG